MYLIKDYAMGWMAGVRIFSSPPHPGSIWGSPSLHSSGYWGALSPG